jgi:hypothetical protein
VREGVGVGEGEDGGVGEEVGVGDVVWVGVGDGVGGCDVGRGAGLGGFVCGGGGGGAGTVLWTGAGVVACRGFVECLVAGWDLGCLVAGGFTLVAGVTTGATAAGVVGFAATGPRLAGAGLPDRRTSAATPPTSTTIAIRARLRSRLPRNRGPRGRALRALRARNGPWTTPAMRLANGARAARAARRNSRRSRRLARLVSNNPRRGGRGAARRRRRRALHCDRGGAPLGALGGVRNCTGRRLPCRGRTVTHDRDLGAPGTPVAPAPGRTRPRRRPPRSSGGGRRCSPPRR